MQHQMILASVAIQIPKEIGLDVQNSILVEILLIPEQYLILLIELLSFLFLHLNYISFFLFKYKRAKSAILPMCGGTIDRLCFLKPNGLN